MSCYNAIWTRDQYGSKFSWTDHFTCINAAFREVARLITDQPQRIIYVADCHCRRPNNVLPY